MATCLKIRYIYICYSWTYYLSKNHTFPAFVEILSLHDVSSYLRFCSFSYNIVSFPYLTRVYNLSLCLVPVHKLLSCKRTLHLLFLSEICVSIYKRIKHSMRQHTSTCERRSENKHSMSCQFGIFERCF